MIHHDQCGSAAGETKNQLAHRILPRAPPPQVHYEWGTNARSRGRFPEDCALARSDELGHRYDDAAAHPFRREHQIHLGVERASKMPLDHEGAKSPSLRRRDTRAATFTPSQFDAVAFGS